MAALVGNSCSLKRERADDSLWKTNSDSYHTIGLMTHSRNIHPYGDPVQQHHTTPDNAGIRPTKRVCSDGFQSVWNTINASNSPAISADPSASQQGATDSYFLARMLDARAQSADRGGEPEFGGGLLSLVSAEQVNWSPNSQVQFPSTYDDAVATSQECISQQSLDITLSVSHLYAHSLSSYHVYPVPDSGTGLGNLSSDSWSPRRASFPESPDSTNTLPASLEPANPAPFISSTQVAHPTSSPAPLADHTSRARPPRPSYQVVSYDPNQNTNLNGGICQRQLEDAVTSESFAMATLFDSNPTDIARKFPPQDNTTSHGVRTMSLDSVTGLSGDQEQDWGKVTTYPCDTDVVHTNPLDQFGRDEPELVPLDTPLGSSFEDLGPVSQALYHNGMCIPVVPARANRLPCAEGKERKKRGQFSEVDRQATSVTRGVGACVRCRAQRIRCSPSDPNDPSGPCGPCSKVSKTNKKTIHRIPCYRYKFATMVLHRSGGLNYTKRFTHAQVVDIGDYSDNIILMVEMTQGLCKMPVTLRVRRFKPHDGDEVNRWWHDQNGALKEQLLQPFCLADVEKTAKQFKKYIDDNALDGLEEAAKGSDDIVKETFRMIANECRRTADPGRGRSKKTPKQIEDQLEMRQFLCMVVKLWFAIRHETGSAWLCGPETLGLGTPMSPGEKAGVPRMIVAQFDSIRHERIYKDLEPHVLKKIESYICSCNMNAWFAVYLASFLLLHQVSKSSEDRRRWAADRANTSQATRAGDKTRYGPIDHPLTALVEYIQEGGRSLLLHWQYFKRCDLMNVDWENPTKAPLTHLRPYQLKFMKATVEMLKKREGSIPTNPEGGCWEDELFWISHLFGSPPSNDKNWVPPDGFTRAKPSVGNYHTL